MVATIQRQLELIQQHLADHHHQMFVCEVSFSYHGCSFTEMSEVEVSALKNSDQLSSLHHFVVSLACCLHSLVYCCITPSENQCVHNNSEIMCSIQCVNIQELRPNVSSFIEV
ncbi:hypothetical protein NL108_017643 [Boleophthalmus pectinirostris]|nr:hypothetical protein NL108_017643 [Boleophthalmus pectinirostris]